MLNGSPNTRTANSKETLCFFRFASALAGSHVQRKCPSRPYDNVYTNRNWSRAVMDVKEAAAWFPGRKTDIMTRRSLRPLLKQRVEGSALQVS